MLDKLEPGDDARRVDADEHAHRLARIADGGREIGVQVNVPEQLVASIRGQDGRIALRIAKTRGAREHLLRSDPRGELGQLWVSGCHARMAKQEQGGQ